MKASRVWWKFDKAPTTLEYQYILTEMSRTGPAITNWTESANSEKKSAPENQKKKVQSLEKAWVGRQLQTNKILF